MGDGWEDWEWDESLFAGAAPHYVRGRLPYAAGLADAMAEALGLDGTGRLLDVGCGPGVVTLRLTHLFDEVVGLDPDAGMLAEAERQADQAGTTNARWVHRRAEELPADLGQFRLITFAASFHWMDRPKVASAALAMLEPGGAVVHVDNQHQNLASPHTDVVADVRRAYLGADTRAGQSIRNSSPSGEDEVFAAAGFAAPQRVRVHGGRRLERTIDELVAETFSASSSAPHLFGDRLADFEADLRAALWHAFPTGVLPVQLPDNKLIIYRAAA